MTIRPEVVDFLKTAIELKSKGFIETTDSTLAKAAGVSITTLCNLRKHGSTVHPRVTAKNKHATAGRPATPVAIRSKVANDYIANELTLQEIADKYKVSKSSVYRWGQEELNREVA